MKDKIEEKDKKGEMGENNKKNRKYGRKER